MYDSDVQEAINCGIIDLAQVKEMLLKKDMENVLKDVHIWQGTGSDKRWKGQYNDRNGKRITVKRTTQESVRKEIYKRLKEITYNPLFAELYDDFCEKRRKQRLDESTIERDDRIYSAYLKDSKLMRTRVREISSLDVKKFCNELVEENYITRKNFANTLSLVQKMLIYAKDNGFIDWIVVGEINDIKKSMPATAFKKQHKSIDKLVFSDDEIKALRNTIADWGFDSFNLAILFDFCVGIRPGELTSLKWKDINEAEGYVTIERQEVEKRVNGKTQYVIKDSPKTEAGYRMIPFTADGTALMLLQRIKDFNLRNNQSCNSEDFVFIDKRTGKRVNQKQVRDRLARLCKKANITQKSTNKIRKTYASMLHESGVVDSELIGVMGHSSIGVTQRCYIKNRNNQAIKTGSVHMKTLCV